jgi:hypothetical protein
VNRLRVAARRARGARMRAPPTEVAGWAKPGETSGTQGALELIRGADNSVQHGRVEVERRPGRSTHARLMSRRRGGPAVSVGGRAGGDDAGPAGGRRPRRTRCRCSMFDARCGRRSPSRRRPGYLAGWLFHGPESFRNVSCRTRGWVTTSTAARCRTAASKASQTTLRSRSGQTIDPSAARPTRWGSPSAPSTWSSARSVRRAAAAAASCCLAGWNRSFMDPSAAIRRDLDRLLPAAASRLAPRRGALLHASVRPYLSCHGDRVDPFDEVPGRRPITAGRRVGPRRAS